MMTNPLKRGEVWLADLNPTQGSEQAGIRPVIIFQNDLVSQFSTTIIGNFGSLCKTVHGFLTVVCDGGGSRNLNREV